MTTETELYDAELKIFKINNALAILDMHTCHEGHTDTDHLHLYKSVVREIEQVLGRAEFRA